MRTINVAAQFSCPLTEKHNVITPKGLVDKDQFPNAVNIRKHKFKQKISAPKTKCAMSSTKLFIPNLIVRQLLQQLQAAKTDKLTV